MTGLSDARLRLMEIHRPIHPFNTLAL